uniref:LAGLIDADG homing endonuclease n=1 Tax=Phanerochaete carnosa TaxID=231932 RepID=A0A895KX04_9APHY|nr:LAGLIDADG homing endonuclease [Phanerochaete carnosa]QRZ60364.1 LAGLIDADG homing endonuclease [Phanerochaete carnosa]
MTYEVPALNLAICWKHFLTIIVESQSAGNLLDYTLLEILREYTPEIICCNCVLISNKITHFNHLTIDYKFKSYLTGLIEGDGCIHVPITERSLKGKLNYPSIHIAFHLKDLPLALLVQKNLGFGSIVRQKGVNAYYLIINDNKGIISMVNLLNGNMRTPKIYNLYKLINWLNLALSDKNNDLNLIKLPLCTRPLNADAWLSGFIEADGHFSVRTTFTGKYPKIECKFELVQSQKDPLGQDKYSILSTCGEISEYLKTPLKTFKQNTSNPQYRLRTSNLESNFILTDYLNKYPLFGSKFLDFNSWKEILDLFRTGFKLSHVENIDKVVKLKSEMNNNRTIFNWDHLNKFYTLNY